jgi:hypothetical protein
VAVVPPPAASASGSAALAQAKKDLVVRSDLPKGWSKESGTANTQNGEFPAGLEFGQCLGEPANFPSAPPEADSPYYQNTDGSLEVQDSVTVFHNAAQATSSFEALANPKFAGCATTLLNDYLSANQPKGASVGTVTVSSPLGSKYGVGTNGFVTTAPITSQGENVNDITTTVFFVHGAVGQQIDFDIYAPPGSSAAFPAALIRQVTAVAAKRLGGAQPHSSSGGTAAQAGSATPQAVKSCESDFKVLEVALAAYQAAPQNHTNSYPAPPSPWSQSTYDANFGPLTAKSNGGPFLTSPLATTHDVVEYDASGHVWIEPPGHYDTAYDASHAASNKVCSEVTR